MTLVVREEVEIGDNFIRLTLGGAQEEGEVGVAGAVEGVLVCYQKYPLCSGGRVYVTSLTRHLDFSFQSGMANVSNVVATSSALWTNSTAITSTPFYHVPQVSW